MRLLYVLAIIICSSLLTSASAQEALFTVRSLDVGVTAFDLTVTEVKRESNKSFLVVPGFHKRSAAASRWLMCVYTDLAMRHGFKYWSVVYPEEANETLVLGFPQSEVEDFATTLGNEFTGERLIPQGRASSVDVMATRLCGMQR